MSAEFQAPSAPTINLMPLIDCMFIVLAGFVYATISLKDYGGIELTLPQAASAQDIKEELPIHISLDGQGQIYLNKRRVSESQLRVDLAQFKDMGDAHTVTLSGDKTVSYDFFIQVLDTVRQSGFDNVSLATDVQK